MSCHFLTLPVASEKSCTVKYYRECQDEQYQGASVVNGTRNPILLKLSLDEGMYCFVVTASNSTSFSIRVEGNISKHACMLANIIWWNPWLYIRTPLK